MFKKIATLLAFRKAPLKALFLLSPMRFLKLGAVYMIGKKLFSGGKK